MIHVLARRRGLLSALIAGAAIAGLTIGLQSVPAPHASAASGAAYEPDCAARSGSSGSTGDTASIARRAACGSCTSIHHPQLRRRQHRRLRIPRLRP